MPRRDPIILAWAAGLGLAALIYFVGPDNFMFRFQDTLQVLAWRISEAIANLSIAALDIVRALAIGLYVTFLALAVAVARRGGRSRLAAVVVTIVFLMLVEGASPGQQGRWTAALLLSGIGAAVMSGRLRQSGNALRV
ncbi:MAG: hypothetical protein ACRYGM_00080 [Janthinobacterium lividum]